MLHHLEWLITSPAHSVSEPLITVIIPTCGRLDALRATLDLILPQIEASETKCEVLICDDSGFDDVRSLIHECFPSAQWHPVPIRGAAACRNLGAARATGGWLIFIDDDVLPRASLVSAYSQAFLSASVNDVAFEGATFLDRPAPSLLWEGPSNPNCNGHPSCNWGIRRTFFLEAKGFDERYLRAQDIEFAARVEAMGYDFRPLKEAVVIHPLRRIPSARALAARWEYKLLYTLELGIDPLTARYRMPWHALRVIQSRFKNQPVNWENLIARYIFAIEWAYVLWLTPGWIKKWSGTRRTGFWSSKVAGGYSVAKFGL